MALLRPGCPEVRDDPDSELVDRLRAGDEDAFVALAGKYRTVMLSVALGYVPNRGVAEKWPRTPGSGYYAALAGSSTGRRSGRGSSAS